MNAPMDVTGLRVETERLILRPWQESDLQDFFEYASVEGVGEMAGWVHHGSVGESKAILDGFIAGKKTLALELRQSGKVIGSLGFHRPQPDPADGEQYGRELGFVLHKTYWGRGLMPEAVRAISDYCFRVLDFDYLTCGHFIGNDRSRRVIEKCGFRFYGESTFETHFGTVENTKNYVLRNPRKKEVTNV